jgi:signal transduction histidine kinase
VIQRREDLEELRLRQRLAETEEALRRVAASAGQAKSEFLAHMSHELRTPLTAIIGFSEVLADGRCGDLTGLQSEYVQHILDSGHQLLGMVNDLLELAELRDAELAPVDLGALALEAAAQAAQSAAQQGIRLEVDVAPDLPPVLAEPRQLQKSISHLLRHALEVTPAGERVRLEVRSRAEPGAGGGAREVVASVSDSGPQPAVDRQAPRLALARKVVELQGGRIWAVSDGWRGSTFHVAIPVAGGDTAGVTRRDS